MFANLSAIVADVAELLRPERRLSVTEAAELHVRLGDGRKYSRELTYYMVEPSDCLTSRAYDAVVFCGPARTGKTVSLVDLWIAHGVLCDPDDMFVTLPTAPLAHIYSETRTKRMIEHSPDLAEQLAPGAYANGIEKKRFRNGMMVNFGSATSNTLSGRDIRKMVLSDYDRKDGDLGGEGSQFDLALKRNETFGSRGMTMVESSPGKPLLTRKWVPSPDAPHEAPPTTGILELFNRGDRRRLYAQCQHCGEYWLPGPDHRSLWIPDAADSPSIEERAARAGLVCTTCAAVNGPKEMRALKRSGVWAREGQSVDRDGIVQGEGRRSRIASFWMPGWFAAFQTLESIVTKYLQGMDAWERTGNLDTLKTCTNTDMGAPLEAPSREEERDVDSLVERAEALTPRAVPDGGRFLVASIDVQHGRWVVQMEAFGVAGESWIVDRFEVVISKKKDADGRELAVDPASREEDWSLLDEQVVAATYPLDDDTGRRMAVHMTVCDMHGERGVTGNAYRWWRTCRGRGLGQRVRLSRGRSGGNKKNGVPIPRVKETVPEQSGPGGKKMPGDIPILQMQVDALKGEVYASVDRRDFGPGYLHMPAHLPETWFRELLAETETPSGTYVNENNVRNETLDLCVMARAGAIWLKSEQIDWSDPPTWASPWDVNSGVTGNVERTKVSTAEAIFGSSASNGGSDPWLD